MFLFDPPYPNRVDHSQAVAEENEDEEDEAEFLEAETYLLPLGACQGDDDEARRADGYQLPIVCQVRTVYDFALG